MPTLVQLQYALAVKKHRHFGKASEECHVTQPTLSQQLQKLEDEVGLILFDRTKKPILITPEGERFLAQASVVVREHDKLMHISKQSLRGGIVGEFHLGVIPTVSSDLLPLFLKPFSKAYSRVDLVVEEMKTETILSELSSDRLDGAILATPIKGGDFKVHPLYYEPFFVYLSAGHELLKRSHVTRADLDLNEMWLLQDGHCFKDQVLNYCAFPKSHESALGNVRFQSGSLDTLRRMVERGRGYTLIPALMALAMRKDERATHVRPFKAPVPTREISLIYRRDHWKLEIIRALEKAIVESLPSSDDITRKPERSQKVLEVC